MNARIKILTWSVCFILIAFTGCQSGLRTTVKKTHEAKWEKLGPGGGGAIFIPTFSYKSPDHFLLRCDMTGSYLTRDGGTSYQQINFAGGASSYTWDPIDSNIVYVGSASLNRSVDGGRTWERIFPSKEEITHEIFRGDHADYNIETTDSSLYSHTSGRISAIRADPMRAGSVYFSMGRYFFYTSDAGKSWKRDSLQQPVDFIYTNRSALKGEVFILTASSAYIFNKSTRTISRKDLPEAMSPAFSFTGGTVANSDKVMLYALHHDQSKDIREEFGHSEVWQSDNLGDTWKRITDPVITNKIAGIKPSYSMIACSEYDAGNAYLISNRYEEKKNNKEFIYWYGALKTGNSGKNWEWVWKGGGGSGQYAVKDGIGVSNLKDAWAEKAFGGEYIRLMDVGVSPTNGKIAIVTDWYRTMKTMDGGKSWNEIYSARQPDGTFISRGLDVTTAYGVHFDPFDSNHIAISYTDIGYHHSFNRGKSWVRSTEGVPPEWINTCYWMVFDPAVKDKIWSVWSYLHDFPRGKMTRNPKWKEIGKGGVCVSVDGGKTWKPEYDGMGFDSPATSIVLDPESAPGNRTLYVSVYSKGVFKSTDDGKTWHLKNNGIEENTCAFELTLTSKGILFLTVSATPMHKDGKKGTSIYSGAVYRSADGAETWTKLNVADGIIFPNGIDYDRQNPDRLYLGCWADIDLSDLVGGDVVRANGGNKPISMPGGIFLSEDGGDTWTSIFDEKQYVYDVTVDPYHAGRVYCCTFNQAAWRSDDYGKVWKKIKGYDFHWGQRIVIDKNDPEQIYITTFGSSVWHGIPIIDK
jgi:photosystem II stability/assembly factor-like uncharacterized protein